MTTLVLGNVGTNECNWKCCCVLKEVRFLCESSLLCLHVEAVWWWDAGGVGQIVDEEEEQEEAWRCCRRRPLFAAFWFGADQLYKGTRPTTFGFFFFVLGATMDPSRAFIKDAKRVVVKVRWLCLLFAFFFFGGGAYNVIHISLQSVLEFT